MRDTFRMLNASTNCTYSYWSSLTCKARWSEPSQRKRLDGCKRLNNGYMKPDWCWGHLGCTTSTRRRWGEWASRGLSLKKKGWFPKLPLQWIWNTEESEQSTSGLALTMHSRITSPQRSQVGLTTTKPLTMRFHSKSGTWVFLPSQGRKPRSTGSVLLATRRFCTWLTFRNSAAAAEPTAE